MTFEEILARDGRLVYRTKGVSMRPMLRQNRDLVVIRVPVSSLRKFDVALYKRGKDYMLHRVIEAKDGYYLIRCDNAYSFEHVPDSAVIGVLSAFPRTGKLYDTTNAGYQRYSGFGTPSSPCGCFVSAAASFWSALPRKWDCCLY